MLNEPKGGFQDPKFQAYVGSEGWLERAKTLVTKRGGVCESCWADQRVVAQHRDYDRLGRERVGDVWALCVTCRDVLFERYFYPRRQFGISLREAGQRLLHDAHKRQRGVVLAGHDGEGRALVRRARFFEALGRAVKLHWRFTLTYAVVFAGLLGVIVLALPVIIQIGAGILALVVTVVVVIGFIVAAIIFGLTSLFAVGNPASIAVGDGRTAYRMQDNKNGSATYYLPRG